MSEVKTIKTMKAVDKLELYVQEQLRTTNMELQYTIHEREYYIIQYKNKFGDDEFNLERIYELQERIDTLEYRREWIVEKLDELGIEVTILTHKL